MEGLQDGKKEMTAVQKLRHMLADQEKLIVCPGIYDGYTARIALSEGAECLYMVKTAYHIPLPSSQPGPPHFRVILHTQR
jgi:hypothetical protein